MSAEKIERFIQAYRVTHPDFKASKDSDHPVVLAMTNDIMFPLMDELGGVVPYWSALIDALPHWFKPGETCFPYQVFFGRFQADCGMSAGTKHDSGMCDLWARFVEWKAVDGKRNRIEDS